jgi:hypothetical protein
MKARIKATGEIVEVQRLCMSSEGGIWRDIWQSETGQEYFAWMLDFDFKEEPTPKYTPDYWTRLEHQAAIAAMGGMCGNTKYNDYAWVDMAKFAIKTAHALVEKLKESK